MPQAARHVKAEAARHPDIALLIALRYVFVVKVLTYGREAAKDSRRHGNMTERIIRVVEGYAADPKAHAKNVAQLVGSTAKRLRVGDHRVIFEETETAILVTKVGPCGGVYDRMKDAMTIESIVQDGRERVVLDRAEYEDIIHARDHAAAMQGIAVGASVLTAAELTAYLAAPTPLAFWRKRAGKTQAALAAEAGVSQPFLAQIEAGRRTGTIAVLARIAQVVAVRIDDLVEPSR